MLSSPRLDLSLSLSACFSLCLCHFTCTNSHFIFTHGMMMMMMKMGTMFKEGMFNKMVQKWIGMWAGDIRSQHEKTDGDGSVSQRTEIHKMVNIELSQIVDITQQETVATQETVPHVQPPFSSSQAQLSS